MTILLAYDGRQSCERALDYAIRHAVNFNEPLYILTVVSKDRMDPEDPDHTVREYMEAAQRKAFSEGATVHTIVEVGRPDETVLDVSNRFNCDTIIVGRSDRSSLDRLFLGSVSDYIVKNAECTVILVSSDKVSEEE